jgi:hypothetical protein
MGEFVCGPSKFTTGQILLATCLRAQADDSDARPPVTKANIVRRAAGILNSPEKWNRAANRVGPSDAKTLSLYCALERATDEVSKNFQHRGGAVQEARFVIQEIAPDAKRYSHRLMDYNNDPNTSFAGRPGGILVARKAYRRTPRTAAVRFGHSNSHRRCKQKPTCKSSSASAKYSTRRGNGIAPIPIASLTPQSLT